MSRTSGLFLIKGIYGGASVLAMQQVPVAWSESRRLSLSSRALRSKPMLSRWQARYRVKEIKDLISALVERVHVG
jgi:hypothetical protein